MAGDDEIKETLSLLSAMIESTADGILVVDGAGGIARYNQKFLSIWRIPESTARAADGRGLMACVLDQLKDPCSFMEKAEWLSVQSAVESFDILEFRDGRIIERHSQPQRIGDQVIGRVWSFRDITDRRLAEEALRESEGKYRFIAERMSDLIWTIDLNFRIQYVSPSIFKSLGFTAEEWMREPLSDKVTPEAFVRIRELLAFELGRDHEPGVDPDRSVTLELETFHRDGSRIWFEHVVSAIRDAQGRIIGVQGVSRNIASRRRAEEELRESEEKFRSLFQNMSEGVALHQLLCDAAGRALDYRIVDVNPAYEKQTGVMQQAVKGGLASGVYGTDMAPFLETYGTVVRTGEPRCFETYFPPMQRHFEISVFPSGQGLFATVFSDITERKRSEMALTESNERLKRALGSTVQAMAATVETRDPYTAGHQRRVADLASAIASEMGLSEDQAEGIRMAAMVHDIGKISIPAEILCKPTKLTQIEFELIKMHPQSGYDILKDVHFPWPIARIVLEHHERMNGTGYPAGLKGEMISLDARILAVADVVEAIASHRPDRPARETPEALEEITKHKGVLYDPEVAEACRRLFQQKAYRLVDRRFL